MLVVGHAEVDEVDRGVGEQVGDLGECRLIPERSICAPFGPKLPRMPVQSPASFFGSRMQRATTLPPARPRAAR